MTDFLSFLFSALLQLLLFSMIPFIWWLITDRKTNLFQWIGLKKPKLSDSLIKLLLIIVVVAGTYIVLMGLIMTNLAQGVNTATNQFQGKGASAIPKILIYAIIQTSLSEEIFFRGFLCKRLSKKFGFTIGNGIQAVLFGLLHGVPFGLATGNWLICVLITVLPTIIGFTQGWLNERKAGGSIIPSWILHGIMNLLSALTMI